MIFFLYIFFPIGLKNRLLVNFLLVGLIFIIKEDQGLCKEANAIFGKGGREEKGNCAEMAILLVWLAL